MSVYSHTSMAIFRTTQDAFALITVPKQESALVLMQSSWFSVDYALLQLQPELQLPCGKCRKGCFHFLILASGCCKTEYMGYAVSSMPLKLC